MGVWGWVGRKVWRRIDEGVVGVWREGDFPEFRIHGGRAATGDWSIWIWLNVFYEVMKL